MGLRRSDLQISCYQGLQVNRYPSLSLLLGHAAIYMHRLKLNLTTHKVQGSYLKGTSNQYMTWDSTVWDEDTSLIRDTTQNLYRADLKQLI